MQRGETNESGTDATLSRGGGGPHSVVHHQRVTRPNNVIDRMESIRRLVY